MEPGASRSLFMYGAVLLAAMVAFSLLSTLDRAPLIDLSDFKAKIRAGTIKRVQVEKEIVTGFPQSPTETKGAERDAYRAVLLDEDGMVQLLDSMRVEYYAKPKDGKFLGSLLSWVVPAVIFLVFLRWSGSRQQGMGQGLLAMGKSRAHRVAENDVNVTFEDVAGVDEAKEELQEVIDFLKQPGKYDAIGGKIPKGVLLVGPPGTGKTLLARAVAGEAKVPFFQISGAEFVEMIVGVGAARVRDMFKEARQKSPCIIFIDELDAIGKSRSHSLVSNDEREQTLNQLLVEMQGFDARSGVIVLAATNRPDVLDPALLRPGRFDRHILVDRPDLAGREAILRRHARNVRMDPSVDLKQIAQKTPGFVGADLANIVNESALLAVRAGRTRVLTGDVEDAIEKVVSGLKQKSKLITPKEKKTVAYHETGHALVAAFTPGADPVDKISIVPRGYGALGFTLQTPAEDRYLTTESELIAKIDVLLGGRAAEELVFGEVSTGAANDLTQSTEIARRMMVEFGMSEKFRDVVFHGTRMGMDNEGSREPAFTREYSERTQQYIDERIASLVHERGEVVRALLRRQRSLLDAIAGELLRKEGLSGDDFRRLLEKAPPPIPALMGV